MAVLVGSNTVQSNDSNPVNDPVLVPFTNAVSGTGENWYCYATNPDGDYWLQVMVYDDSDDSLLATGSQFDGVGPNVLGWRSAAISVSISSGTNYIVSPWANHGFFRMGYNNGGGNNIMRDTGNTWPTPPDPISSDSVWGAPSSNTCPVYIDGTESSGVAIPIIQAHARRRR